MNYLNLYGRALFATAESGGAQVAGVILTPGDGQQAAAAPAPEAETPASEGKRKLDKAAGGDEVPLGPLGGPELKTREEMVVETNEAIIEQAEAEIEAAGGGSDTAEGGGGDTTEGGGGDTLTPLS